MQLPPCQPGDVPRQPLAVLLCYQRAFAGVELQPQLVAVLGCLHQEEEALRAVTTVPLLLYLTDCKAALASPVANSSSPVA